MERITAFILIFIFGAPLSGWAAGPRELPLVPSRDETARVVGVIDGETLILNNAREVRLVGIQAPPRAKAFLASLILKRIVELHMETKLHDRYGRLLAQVVRADDGLWLQGALLKAGLARVYTMSDNRLLAAEMLARERQARAAGRGIWKLARYAIRTPQNVRRSINTLQIVEGRVKDVAQVGKWIYLNFGADWRHDFTVKISVRNKKKFLAGGLNPLTLKGQRIRVRGWVLQENGPMIVIDHPERLEMIKKQARVP